MAGAQFFETEDSIDASVEAIVEETWGEIKQIHNRLRKHMLVQALKLWVERQYVVVPDDYMDPGLGEPVAEGD